MGVSLVVAIYSDLQREKHGLQTIYTDCSDMAGNLAN